MVTETARYDPDVAGSAIIGKWPLDPDPDP
jgi:hypothetical protein